MNSTGSISQENYLKAIFKLQNEHGIASNQAIAEKLAATPAAVTGMLRKLTELEWVEHTAYQGAVLTPKGKKIATSTIRKHRLWEVFLVEKLQFKWDAVHQWAEELEHIGDADFTERLDAFLGCPATDPHGDPIPDANGDWEGNERVILADVLACNQEFTVRGVSNSASDFLRHLDALNIQLGKQFSVVEHFPFDGSWEWKDESGVNVRVSREVASQLLVELNRPQMSSKSQ